MPKPGRKILFFLYGVLALGVLALLFLKPTNNEEVKKAITAEVLEEIGRSAEEGTQALNYLMRKAPDSSWVFDFKERYPNWDAVLSLSSRPVIWTSNSWLPDSNERSLTGQHYLKSRSGWIQANMRREGNQQVVVFRYVFQRTKGFFQAQTYISPLQNLDFELSDNPSEYVIQEGQLYIHFYGNLLVTKWMNFLMLFLWVLWVVLLYACWNRWNVSYWIMVLTGVALYWLTHQNQLFGNLELFKPGLFASSEFLPSLGAFLLLGVLLFSIVLGFYAFFSRKRNRWILIRIVLLFMSFLGLFEVLELLILNSKISFDVTHLSSLSIYSVAVLLFVAGGFWVAYKVFLAGVSSIPWTAKKLVLPLVLLGILSVLAFDLIHISFERSFMALGLTALSIAIKSFWSQRSLIGQYLLYSLFVCLVNTYLIVDNQDKREEAYLTFYSNKILDSKDLEAEFIFAQIENTLAEEFLQPEDFSNFDAKKDQFEKRLRRLYFSGYLDKYDMKVLSFDSVGNNINSSTLYSYKTLNQMYSYQSYPTLSNHFYQIKSDKVLNGYLSKFENCNLEGHFGSIFILLEPKFIQSSFSFPELTGKAKSNELFNINEYSYGIYSGDKLIHQKGSFTYPFYFPTDSFETNFELRDNFNHYLSIQPDGVLVVLSNQNYTFLSTLSTFTFYYFLLAVFLILLVLSLMLVRTGLRRFMGSSKEADFGKSSLRKLYFGIDDLLLSTRIRLAMLGLVFLGLFISVYVTIQFISVNNDRLAEEDLITKTKEIANQVQNEVDISSKLAAKEQRQLIVNEIADVYNVEANLFNPDGYLLASSIEDLYQEELLAPLMHPLALHRMTKRNESQVVQEEEIRELTFTSSYLPLLNERRELIAFLNLPYFKTGSPFDQDLSVYVVTFINIYFLLFLLAFVLANFVAKRISKPLQSIRESMSTTHLGRHNELIEWKKNDEIGRLVKQYNKMVLELESSAEKLSASEREGAWKEMARQVAHEIKNPLTPMKLNIQHLQRAWQSKPENLDTTFNRVTKILVEQIDSLSKLASEFSSFAQMPEQQADSIMVTEVLLNTIHLFEKSENVRFEYSANWPEHQVYADKDHVRRVFNNVIKNAVQAIPEDRDGVISIALSDEEDKILVEIRDNGKGISKDQESKIFVPNFSTKTSGMGLGLAMCRKMMDQAGGRIYFESEEGVGTQFFIEFPKHH
jgi:two-component system nitrogen regulation sensor histidine kinase NtrY